MRPSGGSWPPDFFLFGKLFVIFVQKVAFIFPKFSFCQPDFSLCLPELSQKSIILSFAPSRLKDEGSREFKFNPLSLSLSFFFFFNYYFSTFNFYHVT